MNITKCDKCEIPKPAGISTIDKNAPWIDGDIRGGGIRYGFDLCGECGKDFVMYVKKYFGLENSSSASQTTP